MSDINTPGTEAKPKRKTAPRMVLNSTDKQYICEGLKRVKELASGMEASVLFDPTKAVARIDELIAFYSK